MAKFPKDETSIIVLAQKIANGITQNPTTFPNPPVAAAQMQTELADYFAKNYEAQTAKAHWMHKTQEKNEILERITEAARDNLNYGEIVAKNDSAILNEIGWSGRAAPVALQPPGQCRTLEIVGQGEGFVRLDWKEPSDGGKPAAYKVQRSDDGTNFTDAATAVESEADLFNQPTGRTLIYRAVAINKAGEGLPSNTVSLVL